MPALPALRPQPALLGECGGAGWAGTGPGHRAGTARPLLSAPGQRREGPPQSPWPRARQLSQGSTFYWGGKCLWKRVGSKIELGLLVGVGVPVICKERNVHAWLLDWVNFRASCDPRSTPSSRRHLNSLPRVFLCIQWTDPEWQARPLLFRGFQSNLYL